MDSIDKLELLRWKLILEKVRTFEESVGVPFGEIKWTERPTIPSAHIYEHLWERSTHPYNSVRRVFEDFLRAERCFDPDVMPFDDDTLNIVGHTYEFRSLEELIEIKRRWINYLLKTKLTKEN